MIQNMATEHPVDVQNVSSPELKCNVFLLLKADYLLLVNYS